jgi:predicted transposase YbfD/YdcC
MATQVPPLVEILTDIPDPRQPSGKRYPLAAMLTLACVAVLCGYRSIKAIAEWGPNYGEGYLGQLRFNEHGYPAQATWYRVLGAVNVERVVARVREWAEAVVATLTEAELVGLCLDGKTLRTSVKMGADDGHLLSAVVHQLGVTVGQIAVDGHTNEVGVVEDLLVELALQQRVVIADALLTQQDTVETIIERGGEYLLPVKANQPQTCEAIEDWFSYPAPYAQPNGLAQTVEKGHGRITTRRIETTTALNDYLSWEGLAQTYKLTRRSVNVTTGEVSIQSICGITSLSPQQASAADLLRLTRQHWTIENRLHWVKDVTLDEDRCQLRKGCPHQLMAFLRDLSISILRAVGWQNIASALRFYAARPYEALALTTQPIGE